MLLHIHPRSDTCDDCEPGQVLAALRVQKAVNSGQFLDTSYLRRFVCSVPTLFVCLLMYFASLFVSVIDMLLVLSIAFLVTLIIK